MSRNILLAGVAAVLLSAIVPGCAPSRKYAWGNYDTALYAHYKNPQDLEAHQERLREIVQKAEAGDNVPPGLYAEYGYVLFESGKIPEAIGFFEKEKARWPESNVLMDKMVRNARRHQGSITKSTDADPPAEQEERK